MKRLFTISLLIVLGLTFFAKATYADLALPDPTKKPIPTGTSISVRPTTAQDVDITVTPVPEEPIEPLVLGIAGGVVGVSVITSLFVLLKIRNKNGVR